MSVEPRSLVIGLVAAAIVATLSTLGARQQPDRRGWRQLKPSTMHWLGLWVSLGLTLLMAWVRLFVGSSRPDGAEQMRILSWLIAAFALATAISAATIAINRRRAIRWRGEAIEFRAAGGMERREFLDIEAVGSDWLGQAVVRFDDGTRLRIDPHAQGAAELLKALHRSGDDGGPA